MKKFVILLVLLTCSSLSFMLPVVAYATAGDLDTSFFPPAGYGITSTDYYFSDPNYQSSGFFDNRITTVLSDGSYVTGSGQNTINGQVILQKHMSDGSLDAGFGNGGTATYTFTTSFNGGIIASSIVVQPDSKILVGGTIRDQNMTETSQFLFRFNGNGSVDSSFGTNGIMIVKQGFYSNTPVINVLADGKILVVSGYQDQGHGPIVINRYFSNGTVDTTFGTAGKVTYSNANYLLIFVEEAIVQADGKLLIRGSGSKVVSGNSLTDPIMIRVNTNGSLDNTFGIGGVVVVPKTSSSVVYYPLSDMAVLPNGRILTLGIIPTANHPCPQSPWITQYAISLRKFMPDGTPDASFGQGGVITYEDGNSSFRSNSLVIQDDGGMIVGVSATTAASMCAQPMSTVYAIARLNPDGTVDSSFKNGGVVFVEAVVPGFPSQNPGPLSLSVQDDGRITAMFRGHEEIVQNNELVGVTYKIVTLRLTGDTIMPVPTTQQIFPFYEGIENPILSPVPADLRPIGVGRIATDGANGYNVTDITVSLPRFTNNVDIYVLIYAPAYSPNILFLNQAGIGDSTATAAVPYFANQAPTDALTNLSLVNGVQVLPGEYYAAILVTPSGQTTMGSLSAESLQITGPYYLWATHWTVNPPSGQ